jgi:hypothetical protein
MILIKQNKYILVVSELKFDYMTYEEALKTAQETSLNGIIGFRFPRVEELEIIQDYTGKTPFDLFDYWCLSNEIHEFQAYIIEIDETKKRLVSKEEKHGVYLVKVILDTQLSKYPLLNNKETYEKIMLKSGKEKMRIKYKKGHKVATATE